MQTVTSTPANGEVSPESGPAAGAGDSSQAVDVAMIAQALDSGSMEDKRPLHCTACGSTTLEEGFIQAEVVHGTGLGRWISGIYKANPFSYTPTGMKQRTQGTVVSYRCRSCSHLEQFVVVKGARPLT